MPKVTITEQHLDDIGDAIREKRGNFTLLKPSEMPAAIRLIETPNLEELSATANGTYTPSTGKNGFSQAVVNVPNSYAAGDEGKVVSNGALVSQTSDTVTVNDTYDTTLIKSLTVNVSGGSPNLQNKNITQNGTYTADSGYDGLGTVTVNVSGGASIPSDYQEVEYLECYGGQYIVESNVNLRTDDIIQGHVSLDSSVQSTTEDGFAGGNASDTYEMYFYDMALSYYGRITGTEVQNIQYNTKYEFNGVMTNVGVNFALGRYSSSYTHKGKIWKTSIKNGRTGAVYRQYVPCYRKSDSKAGFYEVIRGVFFTNAGTSDFGKGPDVN